MKWIIILATLLGGCTAAPDWRQWVVDDAIAGMHRRAPQPAQVWYYTPAPATYVPVPATKPSPIWAKGYSRIEDLEDRMDDLESRIEDLE